MCMTRLIDDLEPLISEVNKRISTKEKGGVKKEANLHRWWSRRFIHLYRAILVSFLLEDNDIELFLKGLEDPSVIDAKGSIFLEPMAGGGTGVIEASLYNYNAYGIDVNPIAVKIIHGYSILRKDVNYDSIFSLLNSIKEELSWLWTYNGEIIPYVFITRNRVPTWIYSKRKNGKHYKVILCPNCGNVFETSEEKTTRCPYCGFNVTISIKPMYQPVRYVNYFNNWKSFGFIDGKRNFHFDEKWLNERNEKLKNIPAINVKVNFEKLKEGKRLINNGIANPSLIFTPAQIYTFYKITERSKQLGDNERYLLMLSASDSTKTCSVLSKWYPPLTEPVIYGGGIKGFWVPEYTVEVNPIAFEGIKTKARGTIISSIKKQIDIKSKFKLRGEIVSILGDASEIDYPKSDLIVIDPPYYDFCISYASLSLPHYVTISMFENMKDIDEIIEREIKCDKNYFSKLKTILSKSAYALKDGGRIVLIINLGRDSQYWENIQRIIEETGLDIINVYDILGESPGKLGRSQNRTNKVIVLYKKVRYLL